MEIRRYRDHDRDAVMALAPRLTTGVAPWRRSEAVLAAVRDWVDASLKHHDVDQRPRKAGYSRIMLGTGAGNDGGLAFYAALGYTAEEVVLTRDLDRAPRPLARPQ